MAAPYLKRVVVTGLSMITPLGLNAQATFSGLLSKQSGLKKLSASDFTFADQLKVKVAGRLWNWDQEPYLEKSNLLRNHYHALALNCSEEVLTDSNWKTTNDEEKFKTGLLLGCPRTDTATLSPMQKEITESGYDATDKLFALYGIPSKIVGTVSIYHKLGGFADTVCSGHCSGNNAIGTSYRAIQLEEATVMLAGSIEPELDAIWLQSLEKGNYGYNLEAEKNPEGSVKPFDANRKGWILSEGGSIIILEELEHALNRGAKIYAELAGFSMVSEAGDHTKRDGNGVYRSMRDAIRQAGLTPNDIDAVFGDASGNFDWDYGEASAILRLFGRKTPAVTSIKGGLGHMQGASSSTNVGAAAISVQQGLIPPITNLENPLSVDGVTPNFVTNVREQKLRAVVANAVNYDGSAFSSIVLKAFTR
ncbi:unnamed protein product [Blepharisma stoltei]|uniref:beta-ketoacyl-[acyl-carrier-protein] synthase I n=1 Tax=Blepharisma stoltei TaxID=1481888 RepID=A0AAU9JAB2_9CILI|nr:unnamed protein product [Blepharisma stoltei]